MSSNLTTRTIWKYILSTDRLFQVDRNASITFSIKLLIISYHCTLQCTLLGQTPVFFPLRPTLSSEVHTYLLLVGAILNVTAVFLQFTSVTVSLFHLANVIGLACLQRVSYLQMVQTKQAGW